MTAGEEDAGGTTTEGTEIGLGKVAVASTTVKNESTTRQVKMKSYRDNLHLLPHLDMSRKSMDTTEKNAIIVEVATDPADNNLKRNSLLLYLASLELLEDYTLET